MPCIHRGQEICLLLVSILVVSKDALDISECLQNRESFAEQLTIVTSIDGFSY
jgi:hypothetical protein